MPLGLGYLVALLPEPVLSGVQEVLFWICKLPIFCWIPVLAFWWHYLVGFGYITLAEALSLYLGLVVLMLLHAVLMELRGIADLLRTHKIQLDILIKPRL